MLTPLALMPACRAPHAVLRMPCPGVQRYAASASTGPRWQVLYQHSSRERGMTAQSLVGRFVEYGAVKHPGGSRRRRQ